MTAPGQGVVNYGQIISKWGGEHDAAKYIDVSQV